jgi:SRSO17 transposase
VAEEKKFNQSKYIQDYMKEHYFRIEIKCKPEIKEELIRKAKEAGFTSLSQYLIKKGLE